MEEGLDELIESILSEIAYSSFEGFSAVDLVKAVKFYYGKNRPAGTGFVHPQTETLVNQQLDPADVQAASIVWKWLADRKDVLVGPDGRYNHMSLEEVLSIPESESSSTSTVSHATAPQLAATGRPTGDAAGKKNKRPAAARPCVSSPAPVRPRLHLSEERLWKALTGHGPDLKRIPLFEWKALVAIASVKGKGILQGDLVRLTGQDKRSLPSRTDKLTEKGYIIKQQAMVRGCQTSKLWLGHFAKEAHAEADNEGLPPSVDLDPERLASRGLDPVTFSQYYTGDPIDYLAMGQAFLAVAKGFGTMRYCDMRVKLDVCENTRAMRALAKSSRWFCNFGVIQFTPGVFPGSTKVFKDCVRYIREPTDEEWKKYRATPKTKAPASTRGRAKAPKLKGRSAKSTADISRKTNEHRRATVARSIPSPGTIRMSSWSPYKPINNTIFDIIKRSGARGSTNADVGTLAVGPHFAKWIASLLQTMGAPRLRAAHLQGFTVKSEKVRVGKAMTWKFFVAGPGQPAEGTSGQQCTTAESQPDDGSSKQLSCVDQTNYGFPTPVPSKFLAGGSTALARIVQDDSITPTPGAERQQQALNGTNQQRKRIGRPPKKQVVNEPRPDTPPLLDRPGKRRLRDESTSDAPRRRGRPRKQRIVEDLSESEHEPVQSLRQPPMPATRRTRSQVYKQARDESIEEYPEPSGEPHPTTGQNTAVRTRQSRRNGRRHSYTNGNLAETNIHTQNTDLDSVQVPEDVEIPRPVSPPRRRGRPRKRPLEDEAPAQAKRPRGRPPKSAKEEEWHARGDLPFEKYKESKQTNTAVYTSPEEVMRDESRRAFLHGLLGAYYSPLPPCGTRSGAQNPSLMLAFRVTPSRLAAILGPSSIHVPNGRGPTNPSGDASLGDEIEPSPVESTTAREESSAMPTGNEPGGRRGRRPGGNVKNLKFTCEKCNGKWKNINGLEYHQKKSQSSCNPDYVPVQPSLSVKATKASRTTSETKIPHDAEYELEDDSDTSIVGRSKRSGTRTRTRMQNLPKPPPQALAELPSRRPKLASRSRPSSRPNDVPQSKTLGSALSVQSAQLEVSRVSGPMIDTPLSSEQRTCGPETEAYRERPLGLISESHTPEEPNLARIIARCESLISNTKPTASPRNPPSASREGTNEAMAKEVRGVPGSGVPVSDENVESPLAGKASHISSGPSKSTAQRWKSGVASAAASMSPQPLKDIAHQRRTRTADLIQDLIERNGGVFPGDNALHAVVVKVWERTFSDFAPPDFPTCQKIVDEMAKIRTIKKDSYGAFTDKGEMISCTVLSKNATQTDHNDAQIEELKMKVKDKIRELDPSPYIPAGFPKPSKDNFYEAAALKYENAVFPSPRSGSAAKQPDIQDAAVLKYGMHMGIDRRRVNVTKRSNATSGLTGIAPRKRGRPKTLGSNGPKPPTPSKRQKRGHPGGDGVENGTKRQQGLPALQDMETGAWSRMSGSLGPSSVDPAISFSINSSKTATNTSSASQGVLKGCVPGSLPGTGYAWHYEELMPSVRRAVEASASLQFLEPLTTASFDKLGTLDGDEDEDDVESTRRGRLLEGQGPEINTASYAQLPAGQRTEIDDSRGFMPAKAISAVGRGVWPNSFPYGFFSNSLTCLATDGSFPSPVWFLRQNLPQNAEDMAGRFRGKFSTVPGADDFHRKFVATVMGIEDWELSPEGVYLQHRGHIAPEHIFISVGVDPSRASLQPVRVEWSQDIQYTVDDIPDDIKNAPSDDDLSRDGVDFHLARRYKRRRKGRNPNQPRVRPSGPSRRLFPRLIEYKTRTLGKLERQPRGRRWTRQHTSSHDLELEGERVLVVAFVVIRTLVGGVDGLIDWSLVLRFFPRMALSALRRFWSKAVKERKNFIDALTKKFQTEFLGAYERGELPPIDYDNMEDYDWKTAILWADRLETHERIELPKTREEFDEKVSLTGTVDTADDWRDTWHHIQASTFNRLEAASTDSLTLPAPNAVDLDTRLARSWVRSVCNNSPEQTAGYDLRDTLLKLSQRDEKSLNRLLEHTTQGLMREKVVAKVKGKGLGQLFKLNNNFEKRAEKLGNMDKFIQAATFKESLDESFRNNKEVLLPYDADSGTVMATINLQACGRIRLEEVDFPNIPHGFEPSNYEGRVFPKSYYHFGLGLVPTESYMFNQDMPVLEEARKMPVPGKSARGEVPIWRDVMGRVNFDRWNQFLCAVVFAMAVKGPLTPGSAVVVLRPLLEEFEVELIMDWIDRLGLLKKMATDSARTVDEWWWLVLGKLVDFKVDVKGKSVAA